MMNTQQQNVITTGTTVGVSQPQVYITQPRPRTPDEFNPNASSQMQALSGLQITMGISSIICAIVLYSLEQRDDQGADAITYISHGIWMGLIFILCGGLGMCSATSKKSSLISAVMVLNIITCSIFSLIWISLSGVGLVFTFINECSTKSYTVSVYEPGYYDSYWGCDDNPNGWGEINCGWKSEWVDDGYWRTDYRTEEICNEDGISTVFHAMFGILTVFATIEFIIAIWISALCCGAVCRCCKTRVLPSVQYVNTQVQPSMVIQQSTQSTPQETAYPSASPASPSVPVGYHQPYAVSNLYPPLYGYAANPYGVVPQQHVGYYQSAPAVYQQQPQMYPQPVGIHTPAPAQPAVPMGTMPTAPPPPQGNHLPPTSTQQAPS